MAVMASSEVKLLNIFCEDLLITFTRWRFWKKQRVWRYVNLFKFVTVNLIVVN